MASGQLFESFSVMFCPNCGQERISEATSFCSRCGYLLTGTAELLRTGGASAQPRTDERSPRSRGIRQGLFMFLLMFLVAPIVGIIVVFGLGKEPWPVGLVVMLLGLGGLLRIAYALMFESKYPAATTDGREPRELNSLPVDFSTSALPPRRSTPASEYVSPANWREPTTTEPTSVTDNTTKLLEKDQEL